MAERNAPEGLLDVSTRLAYRDVAAAIVFLEQAFGFLENRDHRVEGANGRVITTTVAIGDAYVWLGGAGAHDLESPANVAAPTCSLMVYVREIDTHCRRAQLEGATIIATPEDMYWGDRRYEALDLDGHHWFFHERTREVSSAAIATIEASFRRPADE